jgi:hypothetical protein
MSCRDTLITLHRTKQKKANLSLRCSSRCSSGWLAHRAPPCARRRASLLAVAAVAAAAAAVVVVVVVADLRSLPIAGVARAAQQRAQTNGNHRNATHNISIDQQAMTTGL